MLLTVDIGNSQTAAALFAGDEICAHWATTTQVSQTVDEVHQVLAGQLGLIGRSLDCVDDVIIASVVPALTPIWAEVARRACGQEPVVVGPGVKTGLPMLYDNPAEVGADRVADAVAALAEYGAPVVVVDLGTATNIEVIDDKGRFLGGIIAPGLITSAGALFNRAARIPQIDLACPERPIGTNTKDAVCSGLVLGEADRIDGLVRRIFGQLGYEAPVVATGGLASRIAPLCTTITAREPRLTLKGLNLIYKKNRG